MVLAGFTFLQNNVAPRVDAGFQGLLLYSLVWVHYKWLAGRGSFCSVCMEIMSRQGTAPLVLTAPALKCQGIMGWATALGPENWRLWVQDLKVRG
jgi:hypothetical protein